MSRAGGVNHAGPQRSLLSALLEGSIFSRAPPLLGLTVAPQQNQLQNGAPPGHAGNLLGMAGQAGACHGSAIGGPAPPAQSAATGAPAPLQFTESNKMRSFDASALWFLGCDRSFMKIFKGDFFRSLELPMGYGEQILGDIMPSVVVCGAAGVAHEVAVVEDGGRLFFTARWSSFVASERIVAGDGALFVLVAPHTFVVRLFHHNGRVKPMGARPMFWSPLLANAVAAIPVAAIPPVVNPPPPAAPIPPVANPPPPAANAAAANLIAVPPHVLGMEYVLGARVQIPPELMQFMCDIWANHDATRPLHACKIKPSQVAGGPFYFKTELSELVPEDEKEVSLFFDNYSVRYEAKLRKVQGICRIGAGWSAFSCFYGLCEGESIVVRIDEEDGEMEITFHPLEP
ncbi:hypothetical protein C2845_PM10G11150 [Panicum miliaceum]|uniref:TF-B3 domain-containing protein n=1 Tax=Panicum miliaceum TaxID=4540 RepID=A0A3L6PBY8_PANMI|nr:hypothetical protein C2845_PM10G11150 [Panicum miliaceum]